MFAKNKVVLALAILATTGVAQAAVIVGGTSASSNLLVGQAGTTTPAVAGAGVSGQLNSAITAFSHFTLPMFKNTGNEGYKFSGKQLTAIGVPGHGGLGVWSFAKVGTQDVWFGEWDAEGTAVGSKVDGTHTAFFVGNNGDVATTVPTTGLVTYAVKSINRGTSATVALPTSTLTANFATKTARSTGDINFTGGTITTSANDVKLAASNVGVTSVSGTGGALSGQFYGTGASAVAGVVKFTDRNKDTAFGGTKN